MNVAFFTESYKPYVNGVSVSVSTFAGYLRARGHSVSIFAPYMPDYTDEEAGIVRYPSVRFRSRWLQYEPDYTMALGRFPGLHIVLQSLFGATTYRREDRARVDRLLREIPVDLIHTQSPFAMGAEGRRWAQRRGVPLVTTFHTLYTEYTHYTPFIPRWISLRAILHWTRVNCNAADMVIAPTEAAREVLHSWGVRRPISILATGIDTAAFRGGDRAAARARLGIPEGALLLLYAGRIAPEKNIPLLFDMLARVARRRPDATLLFAGGGPDLPAARQRAGEMGLSDRVRFLGYVPREDMRHYLAAADVLTFPSATETQGLVLCEAMAAGLPFVSVESPGARSVIPAGYEDYLIANDAGVMAERTLHLAESAAERQRLAEIGRAAAEGFSVGAAGARLQAIYQEVLSRRA